MRLIAAFLVGIIFFGCKAGEPVVQQIYPQDEFVVRERRIGDTIFRYRVYMPPNRKPDEKLPVMLYLHGAGNRGNDNESQLNGLAEVIRANPTKFSFIVVVPQCKADGFWDETALNNANQALNDTVATLNGDSERVYLAGFSLGGYGVWSMAAMFPDKFAAIVPMSGRVLPRSAEIKHISPMIAEVASEPDPYEAFAEKIGSTPVWIFHGSNDRVVSVDSSRQIFSALRKAGNANVKYSEVQGAGHESLGFQTPELFDWLSENKRAKE